MAKRGLIIGGGIAGPALALAFKRAGIAATIYEATAGAAHETGAFLGLAPNGVNVLKALGCDQDLRAAGFASQGMVFLNHKGRRVGALDSRAEERSYGAQTVVIKRGLLHTILRDRAMAEGITIEFGKKLVGIDAAKGGPVTAHFSDGTTTGGDFLIGCDGLHSATRRILLPDAPRPAYTGMVDCGGFSRLPAARPAGLLEIGPMHMVFGKRAFFSYMIQPTGEVFWFSNVAWPKEPSRGELNAIGAEEWQRRLLAVHGEDPAPIPALLRETDGGVGKWPVYDLPALPTWHKGPVCLVGDAAHATSPHIGQGASLALEDALVLAKCLRDLPGCEQAFAAFEDLRKGRVETLVRQARHMGDRKVPGRLMGWFRDLMLPVFLKAGAKQTGWIYDYKVDWAERVA